MIGYKGQYIEISCKLDDGNQQQYPYATIKKTDGTTETSFALIHLYSGQYTNNSWSPTNTGYFKVDYKVYSDSSHTTLNTNYPQGMETVWVIEELPTSSQVTSSTYGGGGKGFTFVEGKKTPWTHGQRDEVIKNVKDMKAMIKEMNVKMTNYYNDEMKAIDELVGNLENLYAKLKASTKSDVDKVLNEVVFSIKVLKENREKLKNINTINEIPNIKKDIERIYKMVYLTLSTETMEKYLKNQKEEKMNG